MKNVSVTKAVTIRSGVLVLSEEQAAKRAHCLKKGRGNQYEVIQPVQFKVGESFAIDELHKAYDGYLEEVAGKSAETKKEDEK